MLYLLFIFNSLSNIQKFHFMKMFRLLLATASMLVLLFCGTEASAQSDYSGTANLKFTMNFDAKQEVKNINATGVLYYTLESGDFTATKKMIIIE
jgi:ABC-type glycerol-3-phosphate transport system substrate-binding protein